MICTAFSYSATPAGYQCSSCGAKNCKLWRQYQTFASYIELKCATCSGADISTLDADGKVESDLYGQKGTIVHKHEGGIAGRFGFDVPMPHRPAQRPHACGSDRGRLDLLGLHLLGLHLRPR